MAQNSKTGLSIDDLLAVLGATGGDQYLDGLFPEQLAFINDQAKFKSLLTPGRCGKSFCISRYLLDRASTAAPEATAAYVCDTRKHGKQIIFDYFLKHVPMSQVNLSDLVVYVGSSKIELFAAEDARKIEKMRGIPYSIVVVDEAQSIPVDVLEKLVFAVINPRLKDYNAPLILTGTPGEIPHGLFHQATTEPEKYGWSFHSWDQYANVYFPLWRHLTDKTERDSYIKRFLDEEAKRYGGWSAPQFIREMRGQWTLDPGLLIYHLGARNHAAYPADHSKLIKFLAVDLGYKDATAWCVLGHDTNSGNVQLVFERQERGKSVEEVMEVTKILVEQFNPDRVWVDAAGIGSMVLASLANEIRKRWDIPVVAAEKQDKAVIMRMLDNDCRTGRFLLPDYSETYKQMAKLCWDEKRQREAEGQDCDAADACLYAYRSCNHYLKDDQPGGEDQAARKTLDDYYCDLFFNNPDLPDDYLI